MKPDLDKKLRAAFPLVFAGPLLNDEPIRCGNGWYGLLNELCGSLQIVIRRLPEAERWRYRAVQVKEKFGALRFYLEDDNPESPVAPYIRAYEIESAHVCDVCGKPGSQRSGEGVESPMLIRTRCDEHVNWFGASGLAHGSE